MTLGWVLCLAATSPGLDNPAWLGSIGGALMLGAGVCYRWVVIPERQRADRAEARAEKAEEEKTAAYRETLPALAQAEALVDKVLAAIPEVPSRRSGQRSQQ